MTMMLECNVKENRSLCSNIKMVDKFANVSTRCSGHPQGSSEAISHNDDNIWPLYLYMRMRMVRGQSAVCANSAP